MIGQRVGFGMGARKRSWTFHQPEGWVYVFYRTAWPDRIKIGMCSIPPERKLWLLFQISWGTERCLHPEKGDLFAFQVSRSEDRRRDEKRVQAALGPSLIKGKRDIFAATLNEGKEAVVNATGNPLTIIREWERCSYLAY